MRSATDPTGLIAGTRQVIHELDRDAPVDNVMTGESLIDASPTLVWRPPHVALKTLEMMWGRRFRLPTGYWVFPALKKFAKMRYAPGTPAGNSRNQENAVKI